MIDSKDTISCIGSLSSRKLLDYLGMASLVTFKNQSILEESYSHLQTKIKAISISMLIMLFPSNFGYLLRQHVSMQYQTKNLEAYTGIKKYTSVV